MKYIAEMWKRTFDYKGKSGRKEYWIPFALNAALTVLLVLLMIIKLITVYAFIPAIVIAVYLAASFVPFISLTVRRLHDTGKSGWWYLLSFVLGVGTVLIIIMCAGIADTFSPSDNYAATVYGPPPNYEPFDPSDNANQDVYGPPVTDDEPFDPAENAPSCIYGPPYEDEEAEEDVSSEVTFAPEDNLTVDVYGPPMTDAEEDEAETDGTEAVTEETKAPVPELFEPDENIAPAVYGPPDFFE